MGLYHVFSILYGPVGPWRLVTYAFYWWPNMLAFSILWNVQLKINNILFANSLGTKTCSWGTMCNFALGACQVDFLWKRGLLWAYVYWSQSYCGGKEVGAPKEIDIAWRFSHNVLSSKHRMLGCLYWYILKCILPCEWNQMSLYQVLWLLVLELNW